MSGVLCDKRVPPHAKGKIHKMIVQPAMLYGMETVPMTGSHVKKLEVTEIKRCCDTLKPLSHRIVRLLGRTIGCYLANVRPIGNVCYDRQKRSHTAISLSSWW